MSAPARRCTCVTFDDLCPACTTYGKAQANHRRFLSRTPRQEDTPRRRPRPKAAPAPTTPAEKLAAQRHITVEEAERFLARQAASRETVQWQAPYTRRSPQ